MKTIEYWHPKRGIGGPSLEDSDHAFLYEVKENEDDTSNGGGEEAQQEGRPLDGEADSSNG